ncbi:MAG: hypothetical protein V2I37_09870 [Marinilabiliaceae bacterium]|jgi:hypothetical protein|nr:hypothetical protein [Marinilabiliaceae bacterium]
MRAYSRFFLPLFLSLLLFSCEKETPLASYFEYEITKYPVDTGMLEAYGKTDPGDAGYNFDITLHSSGIIFDPVAETFSGYGNIVYLEMYSASEASLEPGTYTFDNTGSGSPQTFDIGRFGMYVNMDEQSGTIVLANSGSVRVEKSGATWTLNISCTTSAGNPITGFYKGELEYFDRTN